MNSSTIVGLARQAVRLVLAPTLATLTVTAGVCWLVGWRTLTGFTSGLLIAAGLIFGAGAFGMLGGRALDNSYRYMTASSVSNEDREARQRRRLADNEESFAFLLSSAAIAGLVLAVALAIHALL